MSRNPSYSATVSEWLRQRFRLTVPKARRYASRSAAILLLITFVAVWPWDDNLRVRACLVFWIFVPPAWFMFEYHLWAHENDEIQSDDTIQVVNGRGEQPARISFEDLKYGQELASKWWAAVVALIVVVMTN